MLTENEVKKLYKFFIMEYIRVADGRQVYGDEQRQFALSKCVLVGKILEYTDDKVFDDVLKTIQGKE